MSLDLTLRWDDVRYAIDGATVLDGLSGALRPRRSLAILGASGAGKTSFLNAISDRLAHSATTCVSGEIALNGAPYRRAYRPLIGYVPQDDVLPQQSTTAEVLTFAARVRCGLSTTKAAASVESVLGSLRLTDCRDLAIGAPGLDVGLSGGERKRVNIGVELISDPQVLLLDEPISGLDSVTAELVVSLLRGLARQGRTVAYTIHQPTSDCFQLFDDLMLMVGGRVAYHGPADEAVEYFATMGFDCPERHTPTDYFMHLMQDPVIAPRLTELWEQRCPKSCSNDPFGHSDNNTDAAMKATLDATAARQGAAFPVQMLELAKRSLRSQLRNRLYVGVVVMRGTIIGVFLALVFVNLQDTVTGVADRHGLLLMLTVHFGWIAVVSTVTLFPPDRAVFIRDQQTAAYSPLAYGLTKLLADAPLALAACLLTCSIVYFVTGLAVSAAGFFTFVSVLFTLQLLGTSIGFLISVSIESYALAMGCAPLTTMPFLMAGGLLASTDRLRPHWVWLEKLSYFRWAFVLLERNEFGRIGDVTCDPSEFTAAFCARQPRSGDQVLDTLGFRDAHHEPWLMWLCFAAAIVVLRGLGIVMLYVAARRKA